jgi:hypothetical protein
MENMKTLLTFLLLGITTVSAQAEDKSFRFGGQLSLNSYKVDDPVGSTEMAFAPSIGAKLIMNTGRDSRWLMDVTLDKYKLKGTDTNVGEDVKTTSFGVSYQSLFRLARDIKPWVGVGLGYGASSYSNRFVYTSPSMTFKTLYADRSKNNTLFLVNSNIEWGFTNSLDMGIQVQYEKSISDKSGTARLGLYLLY